MRILTFILILLMAQLLFAETWTNTAGHAISVELVARKGDMLTMKRAGGSTFTIHLSALSKESQKAVNEKFPPAKKKTHDEVVKERQEHRLQQLKKEKARQNEN